MIRIENISKTYHLDQTAVEALSGINLVIEQGEFLAISGPSGSGKTTLLNILGCVEKPSGGKVLIDTHDVTQMDADALADLRARRIGFVFQNFNLLPVLTAVENVEFPLILSGAPSAGRREKATECLREVGLEKFGAHKPRELSGGQRQRVAIARALVKEPEFILADEPTANLDHHTGVEILQLMKRINESRGTTFIFSTHDAKIIEAAKRVVRLTDGRLNGDT